MKPTKRNKYQEKVERSIISSVRFKCMECDCYMDRKVMTKGLVFTCSNQICGREIIK